MDQCGAVPRGVGTRAVRARYAERCRPMRRTSRWRCAPPPPRRICPRASFAGQQETLLNVRGRGRAGGARCNEVFASLFNDRANLPTARAGAFAHEEIALSAGIQRMVRRRDLGASGVAFTIDTESGFEGRGADHRVVGGSASWWCKARSTPTSSTCTSRRSKRDARRILRRRARQQGAEDGLSRRSGRTGSRVVDVPLEDRRRFSLSDAEVCALARYCGGHRAPLRAGDGCRVGAGRRGTAASTSSRHARRRCRAVSRDRRSSVSS